MAWVPVHQSLRYHPKTKRAARMLRVPVSRVAGCLVFLWTWSLEFAEDGNLSKFTNADLADAADWDGDVDEFINALLDCGSPGLPGFLTGESGNLQINDWDQYGGKYTDKRDKERNRMREKRTATKSQDVGATSGNVAPTPGNVAPTSGNVAPTSGNVAKSCVIDKIREDKTRSSSTSGQANTQVNGQAEEDVLIDPDITKSISRWREVFVGTAFEAAPPVTMFHKWIAWYGPDVLLYMMGQAQDKGNPAGWLYTTYDNWRKDGEVAPYITRQVEAARLAAMPTVTKTLKVDFGDGVVQEMEVEARG